MFKPGKILELIEANKLTKKAFCKAVGISVQGFDNTLKGSEIGSIKLERIADYLKVPIDYFFERNIEQAELTVGHYVNGNGNKVSGDISLSDAQKEIEHLTKLLAEKERTIQILMNKR